MSEIRREQIAELYYRSQSIKFGKFFLSIHRDHPELPPSPWYMHYPKTGEEPGFELMPRLFDLIGAEFHEMANDHNPPIRPKRIAGLPTGAWGIADRFASHYRDEHPDNLLGFDKIQHADGRLEFTGPDKPFEQGTELDPCEDHISAARNNRLFVAHARSIGLVVNRLFVVVDRQQGGTENLAAEGVELIPMFTADYMLGYGLGEGHITQGTYDEVQAYREDNRYSLAGLQQAKALAASTQTS